MPILFDLLSEILDLLLKVSDFGSQIEPRILARLVKLFWVNFYIVLVILFSK